MDQTKEEIAKIYCYLLELDGEQLSLSLIHIYFQHEIGSVLTGRTVKVGSRKTSL